MSFLAGLGGPTMAAIGGALKPVAAAVPQANAAATGLGKLIGVDGAKISSIADSIGKGMNQIAAAGGAGQGYAAPELPSAPVQNHMQLLDPAIIRALLQQFGGAR